ncbi:hypothetical protein [Vannielia litorea]|uniref:Uncharacterized protein n=1 Tax=Vannielia litorea TaxID=1217970 RepID=A0A1N6GYT5_9RHOB|nr:hypothetical protein [Vannielia litorea]SIO12700.1 hypothetical protein SAMN05444002_2918 [Vannielia litorea]
MTRAFTLLTALLLCSPLWAQSQTEQLGGFKLNLRSNQDVVAGETFKADRDYLTKHGKDEAAAFAVVVPLSGDGSYQSRVVETPQTGLVKFVFSTEGGGLIEAVTFSDLSLPMAEEEPRLEYLMEIMNALVVPGFIEGKAGASRQNIRKVDVGGLRAVEIFGSYDDPTFGKVHWRLLGLPNPQAEAGVVALAQISEEAVPIGSPDDFPSSLSGRVLESLKFE